MWLPQPCRTCNHLRCPPVVWGWGGGGDWISGTCLTYFFVCPQSIPQVSYLPRGSLRVSSAKGLSVGFGILEFVRYGNDPDFGVQEKCF